MHKAAFCSFNSKIRTVTSSPHPAEADMSHDVRLIRKYKHTNISP